MCYWRHNKTPLFSARWPFSWPTLKGDADFLHIISVSALISLSIRERFPCEGDLWPGESEGVAGVKHFVLSILSLQTGGCGGGGQEQKFNKDIGFQTKTSCVTHVILRWQTLGRCLPAEPLCVIPAKHWLHSAVSSRFSVGQRAGAVVLWDGGEMGRGVRPLQRHGAAHRRHALHLLVRL